MLLVNAQLIDGKIVDILIQKESIKKISSRISAKEKEVIDLKGKYLFPGFIDLHVHLRDPGQTHKEDIGTGTLAAARGGYTTIGAMPNTMPILDSIEKLKLLKKRLKEYAVVRVLPIPAITIGSLGEELTDFVAFSKNGVVALTDDGRGVENRRLMREALARSEELGLVIMQHAEFKELSAGGVINAGNTADRLKLKGISPKAEIEMIRQDTALLQEVGGRYHVQHVSLKESLDLIIDAKKKGLNLTSEVTPHHLLLEEASISQDDANYKMNPPLRANEDRLALISGLREGWIDMVATDHAPHTKEEKEQGFLNAPFGVVGLEFAFPLMYTELVLKKEISLACLVKRMTIDPANSFDLPYGLLEEGTSADLVVVDLEKEKGILAEDFLSKGKNTPFMGRSLKGWPVLTICRGKKVWNDLG